MLSSLSKFAKHENISQMSADHIDSKEAAFIVKKTWRELMKNEHEVGKKIFELVLTKEISMSVLFINSQIDQQATLFMKMMDAVIGFLDNEETMDEKLLELGVIHSKKYGVKKEHYKPFRTAFMNGIKIFIPWNARRENAWLWFWDRIIRSMTISSQTTITSFVAREKVVDYFLAIHESLDNVMESPVDFGNKLYHALLNNQCEITNLFPKTDFESQSAHFVSILGHTVRLLNDQTAFQNKIRSFANQYQQYGIKISQLELFGEVFIKTLKVFNNGQWKPIHDEAWEWILHIVVKIFKIELEENNVNILVNDNHVKINVDVNPIVNSNVSLQNNNNILLE